MKYIFAVDSSEALKKYRDISDRFRPCIHRFLGFLQETYQVLSLPRCVVWTDRETATYLISDIPVPAYTNDYRTVFCPDIEVWKEIYQHQLEGTDQPEIRKYYEQELTQSHILQIIGHEFVHHSDLFIEEAYDSARWFEEGMCEYISRWFFLTQREFDRAEQIQKKLVISWEHRTGTQPLKSFDASTYRNSLAAIFYEYWRSFLTVKKIVDMEQGNVMAVFEKYHDWYQEGCPVSLEEWFNVQQDNKEE